ncbi:MAG: T9SS type A sorting domain-containing protein [Saprospiraceae bacterium]|nr:T9SS type A sorting domain-containing protein [Saprospiraceae bacterium]
MSNRTIFLIQALTFSMCCVISIFTYSQDGSLDLSFDHDGKITTAIGNNNDLGNAVIIQLDGKIVIGGKSGSNAALVRYQTNGSLDNTFGTGGILNNIGCFNFAGNSLTMQSDGKLLVGGYCGIFPNFDFALTRFHSNGILDNTFGTNGTVITPVLNGGDQGMAVAIQSDGKILQGGYTDNGSNSDFALLRYLENGTLDSTFGNNGKVTTAVGIAGDIIRSIVVQSDGKIVVSGFSYTASSFSYDFVLVRYNSNGSIDQNFGSAGVTTTAIINSTNDYGESMTIQVDGKIIVGGYSYTGYLLLARYDIHGKLDNSFGNKGTVSTLFGCAYQNKYSIILQSDGKILIGGYSTLNSPASDFSIARYKSNGTLDNSFGSNGIVRTPIGNGDDIATSIAIQPDGKIVLAGSSYNGSNFDFAAVRYNNEITTGVKKATNQISKLKFYPNPFSSETKCQADVSFEEVCLTVYDFSGFQVKQQLNISGKSFKLERDNLPAGLYFIRFTQKGKTIQSDKLVIID